VSASRTVALIGLVIGLAALVLQFAVSIPAYMANGRSLPDAIITFVSFFTILSNAALVLVYLSEVTTASWLAAFRSPITRGMMVGVMILVCVFYHVLLSSLTTLEGLSKGLDLVLHYVAPVLYVFWWLAYGRRGVLKWEQIPSMLFPTLVYFIYTIGRGAVSKEYPYPSLDVNKLGFGHVLVNAVYISIGLALLCALVVLADKLLPRKSLGIATP